MKSKNSFTSGHELMNLNTLIVNFSLNFPRSELMVLRRNAAFEFLRNCN